MEAFVDQRYLLNVSGWARVLGEPKMETLRDQLLSAIDKDDVKRELSRDEAVDLLLTKPFDILLPSFTWA